MGILELTPSIRADTEAFEKALGELGWSKDQYHRKIKRAGLSLADKTSKKNFLNNHLKKIGSSFQYKNIMVTPTEPVHTKGAVETGMGGKPPGTRGAPKNAKIWNDGAKIQKKAIKKFPDSVTKQRKFFVDQMKKLYGKIPKKKILDLFKRTIRGIKSFSPMGLSTELIMQMIEKNPELLNILNNQQVPMANKGGMMDINYMTRPLKGYNLGGPAGMTDLERTGYDRSKGYTENLNDLMRDAGSDIVSGIKSKGRGILDLITGKEPDKDPLLIKRDAIIARLNQAVENKVMEPNKAAEIIDSITGSRPLNADLINQLYEEYSIGE